MLHSIKTDLLLHQWLSGVLHDSEHKGYWWMRWRSPKRPVFHCHAHVYLCIWGRAGGGLREKAESAFCIRYWFLIRGPRYKHLSMLYTVLAQLRILFAAPSALWKWIMCRWESRLKCGQQRTFSKCLCSLKAIPERRDRLKERGEKALAVSCLHCVLMTLISNSWGIITLISTDSACRPSLDNTHSLCWHPTITYTHTNTHAKNVQVCRK